MKTMRERTKVQNILVSYERNTKVTSERKYTIECKQNQSFSNLNFKTNKILHKMHSTFFSSRRKVRICFNKFGFYFWKYLVTAKCKSKEWVIKIIVTIWKLVTIESLQPIVYDILLYFCYRNLQDIADYFILK